MYFLFLYVVRRKCVNFTHPNATINISSDGLSAVVTCKDGYILTGDRRYICDYNSTWIGSAICSKKLN